MAMDQFLANMYGTAPQNPAAQAVELEKDAHAANVDLFVKAAAAQNINVNEMQPAVVQQLFDQFVENLKTANADPTANEGTPPATGQQGEKTAEQAAREEWEEKRAAHQKHAEADYAGRVMAHAYLHELRKIAEAQTKVAEMPAALLANMKGKDKDDKNHDGKKDWKDDKNHDGEKDKNKEASISNFDLTAAHYALGLIGEYNKTAGANGIDPKVAEQKLAAVLTLGAPESTKTASVTDFATAQHVRALELLEAAKYPVSWQ